MFPSPPPKERTRQSQACDYCRKKKVKCDGGLPCGNCQDHGKECHYSPSLRRGGRRNHGKQLMIRTNINTNDPVERNEGSFYIMSPRMSASNHGSTPSARRRSESIQEPLRNTADMIAAPADQLSTAPIASMTSPISLTGNLPASINHQALSTNRDRIMTPRESELDQEETTIDLQNVNWEHHGPGFWLSICSEPGMRWVSDRAATKKFGPIAQSLVTDWTKHLTLGQSPIRERYPEPDLETAWKYSTAFFEKSYDSVFGLVYRPEFEYQLRLHFSGTHDDDAANYALCNAVYAVECRAAALADPGKDFVEVQQLSSRYFYNAFSVHADLLFMPSSLVGVRALIVMTSFVELLGSPALEYMLCSFAVRLAQSKGLHRQPSRLWRLPAREVLHRNWTFWAIYCYDKYIALRSGRPSVIDDDDISCEIPNTIPDGSTIDIEVFTASIRHAQVCSQILKGLFSARGFRQPSEKLFASMDILERRLQEWRDSLPGHLFPSEIEPVSHLNSQKCRLNIIRLHSVYYGSVVVLHAILHYPWICSLLLNRREELHCDKVSYSSAQAAIASRKILSSLRYVTPDFGSSQL